MPGIFFSSSSKHPACVRRQPVRPSSPACAGPSLSPPRSARGRHGRGDTPVTRRKGGWMGQDSAKQMRSVGSGGALGMAVNFYRTHYVSVWWGRSEIDRPQMRQGRMRADTSEMRSPNREWAGTWLAPARPTALYSGRGQRETCPPSSPRRRCCIRCSPLPTFPALDLSHRKRLARRARPPDSSSPAHSHRPPTQPARCCPTCQCPTLSSSTSRNTIRRSRQVLVR